MAVASAGMVGYPVTTFLKLPKSMSQQGSMEVPLADLAEGTAIWGEHLGRQIAVIKVDGQVRAFNGACPHLGCVVQWEGATRTFKCPCHGAVFSDNGKPVAGPVNAPLESVPFQIQDDVLRIT
ncbi:MAG: Rieske 2Fe-2S domain-containing protein [Phycisphaerales bacterium]|nr:MAG: Rieske 2Fe-2S domain-containing protein [Phycisphaerales bacterium]